MGQQPSSTNEWSIPKVIYEIPDSVRYVKQFDAGIFNDRMDLLIEQFDTSGIRLDYSEVYFIENANSENQIHHSVSNKAFSAEDPRLIYSNNDVHFFWGERRYDPEFNEWDRPRAPLSKYATSIFSSSITNSNPIEIYKSGLWVYGLGDVTLPVNSVYDNQNVYASTTLDSTLLAPDDPGVNVVGFFKKNILTNDIYMSKPIFGHTPSIVAQNGEIWLAYLGSDTINYGRNNTYVMKSQDDGMTWANPLMLSQSEDFQVEISIKKTNNNSLHIVHSTSTDEYPVPNQLWHTFGENLGTRWHNKTLIYDTENENVDETLLVSRHSMVTDSFGQVHIVMKILGFDLRRFGVYTKWNPLTQTWSSPQKISIDLKNALFIDLEVSDDNTLHLFWDDMAKRTIQFATKEITAPKLPEIFKSNQEIQLHNVYPNPSATRVTIPFTLLNESDVHIRIYSLDGSLVSMTDLGNRQTGYQQERIDVSQLSSGVYIFDVKTQHSESLSGKFTVIRS